MDSPSAELDLSPLGPDVSFERFVPTAGTGSALAVARAMSGRSVGSPRVLLLPGPTAVGKTHLLRAILRHAQQERSSTVVSHLVGLEIVDLLVTAFRRGQDGAEHLGWKGAEFIALDDLHVLADLPRVQHEMALLIKEAAAAGSRVVCAVGGPLAQLETLVTGLEQSPDVVATALDRPSDRDFRRILTRIAEGRGILPGAFDCRAIAASSGGDVRRSIGTLTRYRFGHSLRPVR